MPCQACEPPIVNLASAGALFAVAMFWLAPACDIEQEAKGIGADIAEVSYCEIATCGEVFQCTLPTEEIVEWCWVDDSASELEAASGALLCIPTPRGGALGWPCLYCCGSSCPAHGANAYNGPYCGGA
jgi:hypothetical protein